MPEKGCDIVHILRFKKKPSALKQKLFALLTVFLLWTAHYATSQTVAAGPQHVLLVTSDGKVWSWGYAGSGRLGNDAVSGVFSPAPIAGLTDVIRVAAGREHSVALRRDGTVWIWGDNSRGQLGNGGGAGTAVPVKVADLAGISAIAAGDDHTLAWSVDGSVWAWGANDLGQLGTGWQVLCEGARGRDQMPGDRADWPDLFSRLERQGQVSRLDRRSRGQRYVEAVRALTRKRPRTR
jgi:alpha-tubulin suppressor-like RCC1 family protein